MSIGISVALAAEVERLRQALRVIRTGRYGMVDLPQDINAALREGGE